MHYEQTYNVLYVFIMCYDAMIQASKKVLPNTEKEIFKPKQYPQLFKQ